MLHVTADPYDWPLLDLHPSQTAVIVIDMQRDFCDPEGYLGALGEDLTPFRAPIAPIENVLATARGAGANVIYTRQGYRTDLSDLPEWRARRFEVMGSPVGQDGPLGRILIRGEPGFEIIPELAPRKEDVVLDKTANGAFSDTNLQEILQNRGIKALAFTGNTIDVCVHTTLRQANDLGYQCLLLSDCCGAISPELHEWSLNSIKVEGGVFGSVATSAAYCSEVEG